MPLGKYPTFAACVADYVKSGKTQQQARRICGAIQKKIEGTNKSANQLPASLKAPLERSQKALKFLEQNSALVDTSLDSPQSETFRDMSSNPVTTVDEESYSDKITRIMDEYGVDEQTAVEVVNKLIAEEQAELTRRQFEIQKQLELEKAATAGEGQEPLVEEEPPVEEDQEQQQDNTSNVDPANPPPQQ